MLEQFAITQFSNLKRQVAETRQLVYGFNMKTIIKQITEDMSVLPTLVGVFFLIVVYISLERYLILTDEYLYFDTLSKYDGVLSKQSSLSMANKALASFNLVQVGTGIAMIFDYLFLFALIYIFAKYLFGVTEFSENLFLIFSVSYCVYLSGFIIKVIVFALWKDVYLLTLKQYQNYYPLSFNLAGLNRVVNVFFVLTIMLTFNFSKIFFREKPIAKAVLLGSLIYCILCLLIYQISTS
jgi:hypothetical protein